MKAWVQSRSRLFEFVVVVAVAFGIPAVRSYLSFQQGRTHIVFTDARLLHTVAYELAVGLALLWFLNVRGHAFVWYNLRINLKTTALGLLVLCGSYGVAIIGPALAASFVSLATVNAVNISSTVTIPVAAALSLVNAVYEEVFVTAYIVNTLEPTEGAVLAVLVSSCLRMSYHIYQGALAVAWVLPLGLFYATYYRKTRSLWPLVVAHALVDFISLSIQR